MPTNSVWIRDYGPWWIYEPDNRRAIIDLTYNRPRPQDDAFPELFADNFGVSYYGLGLVEAISLVTKNPSEILNLNVGRISEKLEADLIIFDLEKPWKVKPNSFSFSTVIILHLNQGANVAGLTLKNEPGFKSSLSNENL